MTWPEALAVVAAGLAAGTVNTIIGSGSLVTFPTLLAVGYPPVLANVSNTVGLVFGGVSGAIGYRAELAGQGPRLRRLGVASAAGGLTGGVALLVLPGAFFDAVVPVLVLVASVLVLLQPRLAARFAARPGRGQAGGPALFVGVFVTGIYGGYFGAAQGVILVAILGTFLSDGLQRLNATKNVLAVIVNLVAALLFVAVTHIAWAAAGLIAVGSIAGGQLGATVGRRIPGPVLRWIIVIGGTAVAIRLFVG